ncbi:hypothetical protein [Shouchella rhizosphaerae]|uniref:Uncharacterized protein n=1 Tax=Shouchella rhizosphaerae TaxID=866786 RepID=A0ABZ2CT15_9BACI
MMNVLIKETGIRETLQLIDRETGVDCARDLIGNYDGLGKEDHQFAYDEESEVYITSQENFDWWKRVLDDQQALEDRIAELSEEHGKDKVNEVIRNAGDNELEYQASAINTELDEAFGTENS